LSLLLPIGYIPDPTISKAINDEFRDDNFVRKHRKNIKKLPSAQRLREAFMK
jgi:hypothetical protein